MSMFASPGLSSGWSVGRTVPGADFKTIDVMRIPSLTSLSASAQQIPRLYISALNEAADGSMSTFASLFGPMN